MSKRKFETPQSPLMRKETVYDAKSKTKIVSLKLNEASSEAKTAYEIYSELCGLYGINTKIKYSDRAEITQTKWVPLEVYQKQAQVHREEHDKLVKNFSELLVEKQERIQKLEETMKQWKVYHLEKVKGLEAELATAKQGIIATGFALEAEQNMRKALEKRISEAQQLLKEVDHLILDKDSTLGRLRAILAQPATNSKSEN